MTNKRQINTQMQAIVRRQNIFTAIVSKFKLQSYNKSIHHGITSKKATKKMTQHTIDQFTNLLENTQNNIYNL